MINKNQFFHYDQNIVNSVNLLHFIDRYFNNSLFFSKSTFFGGLLIGVPIGVPLKKYRPEQITVKELKSNIRVWKKKKLLQINVPKNCELRRMKANFLEEHFVIFVSWSMLYFQM